MRAKFTITGVGLLCLLLSQWAEADVYNDGKVHKILSGSYYDGISVDESPPPLPAFTTVIFGGTAEVPDFLSPLEAFNHGRVNIKGGQATSLSAYDSSRVTMEDGTVGELRAHDDARITMHGGTLVDLLAYDNSQVVMTGGYIPNALRAYNSSQVTMNGGRIDDVFVAYDDSQVTVKGGKIDYNLGAGDRGHVTMAGGEAYKLFAFGNGQVTVVGSDFVVYRDPDRTDLVFSGYGDLTGSFDDCYLWGTLASGDPLCVTLDIGGDGRISLVPVPGAVLLGVIGLSLAGWRLRRPTT